MRYRERGVRELGVERVEGQVIFSLGRRSAGEYVGGVLPVTI